MDEQFIIVRSRFSRFLFRMPRVTEAVKDYARGWQTRTRRYIRLVRDILAPYTYIQKAASIARAIGVDALLLRTLLHS